MEFHPASFRDRDARVFLHQGELYRGITTSYKPQLDALVNSGLAAQLIGSGKLISFEVVTQPVNFEHPYESLLKADNIPFISYPYEWSFSQLKDAALLTLDIQLAALEKGMSLKDASAYNVQFLHQRPVFIDLSSFEPYENDKPWGAYGQFCRHFLAPLLLMSKTHIDTHRFLLAFIDGIPLPLASRLLPFRTRFSFFVLMHIHLHAQAQTRYAQAERGTQAKTVKMPLHNLKAMLHSLKSHIENLSWKPKGTWADYYEDDKNNYQASAFESKKTTIAAWIAELKPQTVWDLGANTGVFSRIAAQSGAFTLSMDIDPSAVELHYQSLGQNGGLHILPLVLDLTQPSPAMGWANQERQTLAARGKADLLMALALVHHLCIGNNLRFEQLAEFMAELTTYLIIEFVPKSDSQVQRLLATRKDIFEDYTQTEFEEAFQQHFTILQKKQIENAERVLYLLGKK